MPPFHHIGPKDPMKSKRQSLSQNAWTPCRREAAEAQEKESNPPKGKAPTRPSLFSCQKSRRLHHTVDGGPSSKAAGDGEPAHAVMRPDQMMPTQGQTTIAKQTPWIHGRWKEETSTKISWHQPYLELLKRPEKLTTSGTGPPESERLLSIAEITRLKESSQSRAEKGMWEQGDHLSYFIFNHPLYPHSIVCHNYFSNCSKQYKYIDIDIDFYFNLSLSLYNGSISVSLNEQF